MTEAIITVENLSKSFMISHEAPERYTSLREVMSRKAKQAFSFGRNRKARPDLLEEFWALKHLNFEIKRGDRVGIIGRNGAGKSTLLKILSRITEPTFGRVTINGRVASLLEVGTGFHPELTGRENIFLNGAILGMSRAEIRKKFDEIVEFAEVEKFLDTPVKRFSSGMYVRLAFAVAAHLEPEILIVDEVLAVGDAQFQKKCLGKMEDVSKNDGRTILFVSHNLTALQSLCNKGILLEKGNVIHQDSIINTVTTYIKQFTKGKRSVKWSFEDAPGNDSAKFIAAGVRSVNGSKPIDVFEVGDALELYFTFYNLKENEIALDVTFHLVDEMGHLVFVGSTGLANGIGKTYSSGEINCSCVIPENLMHEGSYNISRLLLVQDRGIINLEMKDVIQFDIVNKQEENWGWMGVKEGIVKPKLEWSLS